MHPVERLFYKLKKLEYYPKGIKAIKERIPGLAFFPGGAGLWITGKENCLPQMPVNQIMIVGQDFDSENGYKKSLIRGFESKNSPTWRNLISLLNELGIALENCFFYQCLYGD